MTVSLDKILKKALQEETLTRAEIICLLGLKENSEQERLFITARKLRDRYFGDGIFLYGFIYFSTWCRNECNFCYYRSSNRSSPRYRQTDQQILEASIDLASAGVHLLDLTMGEDPLYFRKEEGFLPLLDLVERVKRETDLPTMISWGVLPDEVLDGLAEKGADWIACYQETHNPRLFQSLRPGQDYDRRLQVKNRAIRAGLLIEEGILCGVGESLGDVADSIQAMRLMNVHQARVMSFIPQMGTPLADYPCPKWKIEQVIIAVLRLALPSRHIPASLDVGGIEGLKGKLQAGANVVTSIILPTSELKGVAQSDLGISEGHRSVDAVKSTLDKLGLRKAPLEDYALWMKREKVRLQNHMHSVGDFSIEGSHCWRKAAGN